MPKKRHFRVTMEVPDGASIADCKEYILEAVSSWGGSLRPPGSYSEGDPGNPFFSLNRDTLKVTQDQTK
jgi:hypothetical protein